MKKQFRMIITVCILLSFIASPALAAKKQLNLAGSKVGGTWFILCSAFAQVINKYMPDYEASPSPSSGSFENVRNLRDGMVDMALILPNVAYAAYNGQAPWKEAKYQGMRALFNTYPSAFMMVTQADSGIKSIPDMKGKRVAVGSPGSSESSLLSAVLPQYGMDFSSFGKTFPLSDTEASSAIVDGQIDVGLFISGVTAPNMKELTTTCDTRFISIEPEVLDKIQKQYPYFVKGEIRPNTFRLQTEPVSAVLIWGPLCCTEDADEEFVYQFVKAIFEHRDEVEAVNALFKEVTMENVTDGMPIPMHPGAIRYFKEQGLKF